jgi:hypothetical protein
MIINPMMFTRSIKGAPASILFVFMLTRQAMTVKMLCAYTDYKPDSIRDALDVLTGYGLVSENKRAHGESIFSLAEGYEALLPGINPRALGRVAEAAGADVDTPAEDNHDNHVETDSLVVDSLAVADVETGIQNQKKSDSGSYAQDDAQIQNPKKSDSGGYAQDDAQIQNPKKSDSGTEKLPEKGKKGRQNPKKSDSGAKKQGSSSDDDDELINQNKNHHHQSEPEFEKISARKILENLHLIFGGTLDLEEIPPGTTGAQILGWVCKINADMRHGGKIYNPIGLLRTRLASGKSRRILHLDLLPGSFLTAIGLEEVQSYGVFSDKAVEKAVEEARVELEAENFREERLAELAAAVPPGDRETWEAFRAGLRENDNFAKVSWETWVRDAQILSLRGQVLVAARNEYAAKWLIEHTNPPYPITSLEEVLGGELR